MKVYHTDKRVSNTSRTTILYTQRDVSRISVITFLSGVILRYSVQMKADVLITAGIYPPDPGGCYMKEKVFDVIFKTI